jgi:hypothetical protein
MSLWRCPHCAAPQPESARCWVCRRSTTSCTTCAHFRRGVVSGLGFCGLDRRRLPLRGDEIRACWTGSPGSAGVDASAGPGIARSQGTLPPTRGGDPSPRTFVLVDELETRRARSAAEARVAAEARSAGEARVAGDGLADRVIRPPDAVPPSGPGAMPAPGPARWSLWGDAEP